MITAQTEKTIARVSISAAVMATLQSLVVSPLRNEAADQDYKRRPIVASGAIDDAKNPVVTGQQYKSHLIVASGAVAEAIRPVHG